MSKNCPPRASDPRAAFGKRAEELVAEWLVKRGATILARNWRVAAGELDIVAQEGDMLCFVEVRARHTRRLGNPVETVTGPKQRRVIAAAQAFMQAGDYSDMAVRFDVAGVVLDERGWRLTYLPGAFEA